MNVGMNSLTAVKALKEFTYAIKSPESSAYIFPTDLFPLVYQYLFEHEYVKTHYGKNIEDIINDIDLKYFIHRHKEYKKSMNILVENDKADEQISIIDWEVENNNTYMVGLLHKIGYLCDNNSMTFAVSKNNIAMVKFLHDELHIQGNFDAILCACYNNNLEIITLLHNDYQIRHPHIKFEIVTTDKKYTGVCDMIHVI